MINPYGIIKDIILFVRNYYKWKEGEKQVNMEYVEARKRKGLIPMECELRWESLGNVESKMENEGYSYYYEVDKRKRTKDRLVIKRNGHIELILLVRENSGDKSTRH
jgi:hypothetical protein